LKDELKVNFRGKFRNISRILNCVTCEKCRLWGKLQFLGVGTALKVRAVYAAYAHVVMVGLTPAGGQILFAEEREDGVPDITLSKNEVVAMVNALHQLSRSVFDVQVRTLGQQCHPLLFVTTPPCVVAQSCTAYA